MLSGFFSASFRLKLCAMILVFAFFLRLSSPFFIGFSLDMVLFVVSLHIGKFLWLLFRILPPRKKLNNRRLDNMKPRVCRSGLCVINSTPKVGKTFQTAKYPFEKPLKQQLTRNFLIYQVWGLAPIPPPSGSTPKHFVLSEKRPIFAVHKDNLPNDTGELQKISCQGELTEFRHPWQLYSFPTVLIRSSGFLLRLVCLVYLYTSPYPCHKGSKTKHRQKYYQFHNTVILIS